ncbi:MAG: hypothetical protein Q8904_10360 [Bacteroidota bacterium]|nr:hypothetical protein [Bacteroidota bacterium]
MKKVKKAVRALVVIFVVGLGLIHNANKNSFIYESFCPGLISRENESVKNDSAQTNECKLSVYTLKIIDSGINHLISNL